MKTIRQINIKIKQFYFFKDMTNIRDFDPSLLDIDLITFKCNDLITLKTSIVQIHFIWFLII